MTIKDVKREDYEIIYKLMEEELGTFRCAGGYLRASALFSECRKKWRERIKTRDARILNFEITQYALIEIIKTLNVEKIQALTNGN